MQSTVTDEQHDNGVHVNCTPARKGNRSVNSSGSARACMVRARGIEVERFHSHDFEGLLVCGCDDFAWG